MRECMKCGKPTEVPTITISLGPEIRVLRLCETHVKAIRELFNLGLSGPGDVPPEPPQRHKGHSIIPVD